MMIWAGLGRKPAEHDVTVYYSFLFRSRKINNNFIRFIMFENSEKNSLGNRESCFTDFSLKTI